MHLKAFLLEDVSDSFVYRLLNLGNRDAIDDVSERAMHFKAVALLLSNGSVSGLPDWREGLGHGEGRLLLFRRRRRIRLLLLLIGLDRGLDIRLMRLDNLLHALPAVVAHHLHAKHHHIIHIALVPRTDQVQIIVRVEEVIKRFSVRVGQVMRQRLRPLLALQLYVDVDVGIRFVAVQGLAGARLESGLIKWGLSHEFSAKLLIGMLLQNLLEVKLLPRLVGKVPVYLVI